MKHANKQRKKNKSIRIIKKETKGTLKIKRRKWKKEKITQFPSYFRISMGGFQRKGWCQGFWNSNYWGKKIKTSIIKNKYKKDE